MNNQTPSQTSFNNINNCSQSNFKRIRNVVFLIISFLSVTACENSSLEYKLLNSIPSKEKSPVIKVYLETSKSMKGYVQSDLAGDYKLKKIIPFLLTDLDDRYDSIQLFTVTDKPKLYTKSREQFYTSLRNGDLMNGRSSKLHNIFNSIIDSIRDGEISIIISDCILDLGTENLNLTETDLIVHSIYDHIKKTPISLSLAFFKFNSDFNGTYYYDRKNTGAGSKTSRPYYNQILKNRPFYVWCLGNKNALEKLIEKGLITEYDELDFINLPFQEISSTILSHPQKGKAVINPDSNSFQIFKNSEKDPVQITIGLNLSNIPKELTTANYLQENLNISPNHIKTQLKILERKEMEKNPIFSKIEAISNKRHLTHYVIIQFSNLTNSSGNFTLQLNKIEPSWITSTNLNDDFQVTPQQLENKTFAFKYLAEAFYKAIPDKYAFILDFKYIPETP